jgi:bacterioferritin
MLANDLQLEYEVAAVLKEFIAVCEAELDYQTREILENILADTEEDHAYWLEQQLGLIDKIDLPNYLQSQMRSGSVPLAHPTSAPSLAWADDGRGLDGAPYRSMRRY